MDRKWIVPLFALVFAGCGENSNIPLAGDIEAVTVEANATTFYATQQVQMTATASYTQDIPDRNVTDSVTWSESNATLATVDALGLVSGGSAGGEVEITGSYKQFGDSVPLYVHALTSVEIIAPVTNVSQEQTLQLRAEGTFDDSNTLDVTDSVLWVLGNAGDSNATLEQNGTLYTGNADGTLDINVSRYDVNTSLQITVTP
jgi:trimeric autotransporter adhesin